MSDNALYAAMAKAFPLIEGALKDSENPGFKQNNKAIKYADLSSVVNAIKPALTANGMFFTQSTHEQQGGVCIETQVHHSSGESMSFGKLFVPAGKQDAQGYGSALTYARRYSLMTAFGVFPEDDDGNAAVASAPAAAPQRNKPEPLKGPMKTRAEARTKYGEIVRELHGCGDTSTLETYLATEKPVIDQFEAELPDAWNGDGQDFIGLAAEISLAKDRVAVQEFNG